MYEELTAVSRFIMLEGAARSPLVYTDRLEGLYMARREIGTRGGFVSAHLDASVTVQVIH